MQTKPEFITEAELLTRLGIKTTALWRWRKERGFPNPIAARPNRYVLADVEAWIVYQSQGGAA